MYALWSNAYSSLSLSLIIRKPFDFIHLTTDHLSILPKDTSIKEMHMMSMLIKMHSIMLFRVMNPQSRSSAHKPKSKTGMSQNRSNQRLISVKT